VFDLSRIAGSELVAQIDFHESLGSTNDRALEIGASGDVKLPLLVLAERQTAGRGRGANRWLTSGGALTFSLVLEASEELLPMRNRPQVALVAGVAVAEALSNYLSPHLVQLKWPNDVLLGGRKIGGILSESIPGWTNRFVVGIGINVNNRIRGSELAGMATSMIDQDGVERGLTSVLMTVLDEFDRGWSELLKQGFGPAAKDYRERCFLTEKFISVAQHDGSRVGGMCRGIDDYGGLILRTPSGDQALISGSVEEWKD
jgi:BirA family biotin operon repressor/biotin-[acetyl-CoA-carboxylase] ligase